jgi:hypothetical protein
MVLDAWVDEGRQNVTPILGLHTLAVVAAERLNQDTPAFARIRGTILENRDLMASSGTRLMGPFPPHNSTDLAKNAPGNTG